MAGAIVIVGSDSQLSKGEVSPNADTTLGNWDAWHDSPASLPVLGCSAVARTIESMKRAGIEEVSIFGTNVWSEKAGLISSEEQAWGLAGEEVETRKTKSRDAVVIVRVGQYIECEWPSLLEQHREYGEAVTRAFDREGSLDLWIVDSNRFCGDENLQLGLRNTRAAECPVEGYVNRLQGAGDLRRLAIDILSHRCRSRPAGTEVRPGMWMAEGTQIARNARIVAPAYVGRGVKISDDCLVTRCSNVEASSFVDFGTAIEDSSVLSDTYVGIGLDLSHSVVDGGDVLNLHHEIRLRVSDPVVMRRYSAKVQHDPRSVVEMKGAALSLMESQ